MQHKCKFWFIPFFLSDNLGLFPALNCSIYLLKVPWMLCIKYLVFQPIRICLSTAGEEYGFLKIIISIGKLDNPTPIYSWCERQDWSGSTFLLRGPLWPIHSMIWKAKYFMLLVLIGKRALDPIKHKEIWLKCKICALIEDFCSSWGLCVAVIDGRSDQRLMEGVLIVFLSRIVGEEAF